MPILSNANAAALVDLLRDAAELLEPTLHEGCGCEGSTEKPGCSSKTRERRELRPHLRDAADELQREITHAALAAGVVPAACEWCDQPPHPERDCLRRDIENAEQLPTFPPLVFEAPDRSEES